MTNYRQTHNGDIIDYLQENNAMLKVLLWRQEQSSASEETIRNENKKKFDEFLTKIKEDFEKKTEIKS